METYKIKVRGVKIYAYHGCMEEEARVGNWYKVKCTLHGDFKEAARKDDIKTTVNYVNIGKLIQEEMMVRAALIEHVAYRIVNRIIREFPKVSKVQMTISKIHPPAGIQMKKFSISTSKVRQS